MENYVQLENLQYAKLDMLRVANKDKGKNVISFNELCHCPMFTGSIERETTAEHIESFIYELWKYSGCSQVLFNLIGFINLSQNKIGEMNLELITQEKYGLVINDQSFFGGWWDMAKNSQKVADSNFENRSSHVILFFDQENKRHMSTFNECVESFKSATDQKVDKFPNMKFATLRIPSELIFYLKWNKF